MWYIVDFTGVTVGGDKIVGYMSYTSHSSSQIGDSRGDSARHGSRSEEINQSSLFNVGVSDGGVGIILSRSWTRPSPSHHSVDHGRSSGFYS